MDNKDNNIIQVHFKGYEDFISRMDDYIDNVVTYRKVFTPFLTPDKQEMLRRYIGKQYVLTFDGGYEGAENCRACISYEKLNIPFPIACMHATYHPTYDNLRHQDVFGAMMNLGLNREQFGDIVVDDGNIYIYVNKDIKKVIIDQLTKIKRCNVVFEETNLSFEKVEKFSTSIHYISSFRLDNLVASIAHLSRDKAKLMIQAGKVKVNHIALEESSYICHNNCILSLRGYGRFQVKDLEKKTRSNRFCVEVSKYE